MSLKNWQYIITQHYEPEKTNDIIIETYETVSDNIMEIMSTMYTNTYQGKSNESYGDALDFYVMLFKKMGKNDKVVFTKN